MGRTKSIIGSGLFCTEYYNYWLKILFHLTLFNEIARETALPLWFTKYLLNLEFCHKIAEKWACHHHLKRMVKYSRKLSTRTVSLTTVVVKVFRICDKRCNDIDGAFIEQQLNILWLGLHTKINVTIWAQKFQIY